MSNRRWSQSESAPPRAVSVDPGHGPGEVSPDPPVRLLMRDLETRSLT